MAARVKNSLFFTIRDSPLPVAVKLINKSSYAVLNTRYKPQEQTTVFFAAARQPGKDEEALALCRMLLDRGLAVDCVDELNQSALFYAARQGHAGTIEYLMGQGADPNLLDKNGETAIFYAVSNKRLDAVTALLQGGASLEVANRWNRTCMSVAPTELIQTLAQARKKRRQFEDKGPEPKRQRTALEELRSWANEWPMKEQATGQHVCYKGSDIIRSAKGYVVVRSPPATCAARLRVSEKNFVVDHAQLLEGEPWFGDLTPGEWCKTVGVLTDEVGHAVSAISRVVSGKVPHHFTLPLVEMTSKNIAGYVHATHKPEEEAMDIAHIKVDAEHMGQGLGGLLIEAAEDYSKSVGWKCATTRLSVLKVNDRARRCYTKAGFNFKKGSMALWGSKRHPGSEWQQGRKVQAPRRKEE